MTMLESPVRESPAAIRRRLFNPPGGRASSELDVLAEPVARRLRADQEAAEREAGEKRRRQQVIDRQIVAALVREETEADEVRSREQRINELVDRIRQSETELKTLCAESLRDQPRDFSFQGKFSQVLDVVSKFYSIHTIHIISQQRSAKICRPRHVVMWLAYHVTGMSLAQIGRRIGGRDHTTILSGIRKIQRQIDAGEARTLVEISDIKKRLGVE
jgi:chromosomal replication initiation ATPase DnaA